MQDFDKDVLGDVPGGLFSNNADVTELIDCKKLRKTKDEEEDIN